MSGLPARPGLAIIRAADAAAWIDGYAFLDLARVEAEALIESADAVAATARQEGFEAGRTGGEAEAVALLARTVADVDRYLADLDGRLADLALSIVRHVLGTFDDAELVAVAARRALEIFRNETEVTVRTAPALVTRVEALLKAETAGIGRLRVEADPHLSARQCVVTSPIASIDVGLDAQLGIIRSAMMAGRDPGRA